ncbi:hypothetical protein [Bradyrhizobium jicamae]|uniref:hypothetical protein n=1 Tax=Bradyrhizobium jicamae TaxID=280332 RepID=UPI001BAD69BD|nr:hypothetical protein [Bradyrhizobium jicamae]
MSFAQEVKAPANHEQSCLIFSCCGVVCSFEVFREARRAISKQEIRTSISKVAASTTCDSPDVSNDQRACDRQLLPALQILPMSLHARIG